MIQLFKVIRYVVWKTLIWATLVGVAFVVVNAAVLEVAYFAKYEQAHQALMREHQRQGLVDVALRAQLATQEQADALQLALRREMLRNIELEREIKQMIIQVQMFMDTLQRVDQDALRRTIEALNYVPPENVPTPAIPQLLEG